MSFSVHSICFRNFLNSIHTKVQRINVAKYMGGHIEHKPKYMAETWNKIEKDEEQNCFCAIISELKLKKQSTVILLKKNKAKKTVYGNFVKEE